MGVFDWKGGWGGGGGKNGRGSGQKEKRANRRVVLLPIPVVAACFFLFPLSVVGVRAPMHICTSFSARVQCTDLFFSRCSCRGSFTPVPMLLQKNVLSLQKKTPTLTDRRLTYATLSSTKGLLNQRRKKTRGGKERRESQSRSPRPSKTHRRPPPPPFPLHPLSCH